MTASSRNRPDSLTAASSIKEPITLVDIECTELRRLSEIRRSFEAAQYQREARRKLWRKLGRAVVLGFGAGALVILGAGIQAWAG